MDYTKYSVEDFLLDERFRKWVYNPEKDDNIFWEGWLGKNPAKSGKLVEARNILLNLAMTEHKLTGVEAKEVWNNIEGNTEIGDEPPAEIKVLPINPHSILQRSQLKEAHLYKNYQWLKVAGIILIIALFSGIVVNWPNTMGTITMTKKVTERGVKSQVTLSDGTLVNLNSGSELKYMPNFSDSSRDVYLKGEAYFDVAKDTKRPFNVHSGDVITMALGTAFNVNAYPNTHGVTSVALLEGKVQVQSKHAYNRKVTHEKYILFPGKMFSYNRQSKRIKVEKFNKKEVVAWKDGNLYFSHAGKKEVFNRIARWYGVEVEFTNSSDIAWNYSSEFKNQSLQQVLSSLSFTKPFDYEIKDSVVKITFKNP